MKTFKSYVKINQNADVEKEVRTQDKLLADSYDSLREKNMKAKSINTRYIFQNPCHASTLQRSKTQLVLPSTNHTNHTMVQHKAFPSQDSNVFQKFPLRLKATRRHLQAGLLNKDKRFDFHLIFLRLYRLCFLIKGSVHSKNKTYLFGMKMHFGCYRVWNIFRRKITCVTIIVIVFSGDLKRIPTSTTSVTRKKVIHLKCWT